MGNDTLQRLVDEAPPVKAKKTKRKQEPKPQIDLVSLQKAINDFNRQSSQRADVILANRETIRSILNNATEILGLPIEADPTFPPGNIYFGVKQKSNLG